MTDHPARHACGLAPGVLPTPADPALSGGSLPSDDGAAGRRYTLRRLMREAQKRRIERRDGRMLCDRHLRLLPRLGSQGQCLRLPSAIQFLCHQACSSDGAAAAIERG